ncbi:Zinc transporter 7 [Collichthys lucidus]|uniref:Zinc transporter n=1 Tax=Collichthys lucidus TaxID=240159 RepID=A0A4U5ULT2_COLLU|nr:Zinc transporter 7 [Collichthys lucidus]
MQKYDLMIADPICSMLIALLIGVSVVPLLKESIGILMQRTPPSLDHALPECYQRVQQLQGVYNLQEPHFWTLCTDVYIGTLKLLLAPDADTRWILSQTHHIFTQVPERTTLSHRPESDSSMFKLKRPPCRGSPPLNTWDQSPSVYCCR